MATRIFVRKNLNGLWQWRTLVDDVWESDAFYTGDINLLAESIKGSTVCLILPGQYAVSRQVEVDAKDKRLFAKLVPFQIEEHVIDSVDDMVFAYGELIGEDLSLVYMDGDFAEGSIHQLEKIGAEVAHCVIDYLEISHAPRSWSMVLDGDLLLFKYSSHGGFAVEKDCAHLFIQAIVTEHDQPETIHFYGLDENELDSLRNMLPSGIEKNADIELVEHQGSFWDVVSTQPAPVLEFRTGRLARKLPFGRWWQEWKVPAIAAAATLCVSLGALWVEVQQLRKEQRHIFVERDAIYRQIVPKGAIADPVRQLKQRLKGSNRSTDASRVMFMVERIASPISSDKNLSLAGFRYNHKSGLLTLNVEAKDFAGLESLRKKIADTGLKVDIHRASATNNGQKAELRVTEA